MTDFNLDELIHLAEKDLDLFEHKRLELIASFLGSFSYSPAIKRLVRIQKNIDEKISFHVVDDDPALFEQKRKAVMSAFFNSLHIDTDKTKLLDLQNKIESKINS